MSANRTLYIRELVLDVSFYELKKLLVKKAGNHFERNYSTADYINFDFMNDGIFSRYHLHRIKLFNISAFKRDEKDGQLTVRFKLYKATLFLYPLLFILLCSIPYFQHSINLGMYLLVSFLLSSVVHLYLRVKFRKQFKYFKEELKFLINNKD